MLLNANSQQVSTRLQEALGSIVVGDRLYLSHSIEDANQKIESILRKGYRRIIAGGGDGTVSHCMATVVACLRKFKQEGIEIPMPEIGALKLGTGNGIGYLVGAEKPEEDIRILNLRTQLQTQPINLVDAGGRMSFFGGFGLDAVIANDYQDIFNKENSSKGASHGLGAYFVAAFTRSIPKLAFTKSPRARVINLVDGAQALNFHGQPTGAPIAKGEVLYEGPYFALSFGTMPYYGYGMKVFPYVNVGSGKMQLRVLCTGMLNTVTHIDQLWRGTWKSKHINDFLVESVKIELESPQPMQIGGDALGETDSATFTVAPERIPILQYR